MTPTLSAEEGLLLMRDRAVAFYRCPCGHKLPHRVNKGSLFAGRCEPGACVDPPVKELSYNQKAQKSRDQMDLKPYAAEMDLLPQGAEGLALEKTPYSEPLEAFRGQEQAKEAMRLMKLVASTFAREGIHPFPEIPKPPEGLPSSREYAEKRLQDITPYALEQMIFSLRFGENEKVRNWAAAQLLSRAGISEKTELIPETRGPVVILQSQVLPYEKQLNREVASSEEAPKADLFLERLNAKK